MVRPGSRRGVHVCVGVSRKGVVPEVGVVDDNFPFSFQGLSIYTCNHIPRPFILKTMKVCVLYKTWLLQYIHVYKLERLSTRHKSVTDLCFNVLESTHHTYCTVLRSRMEEATSLYYCYFVCMQNFFYCIVLLP